MAERDRKSPTTPWFIKLTKDVLANKTKDLQLAAWLTKLCSNSKASPV